MTKEIELTNGGVVLVDDSDFEKLSKLKWYWVDRNGTFYAATHQAWRLSPKYMHRIILDAPKGKQVDHINHNGLDNRRCNIRLVTQSQNNWNQSKTRGKYKYKGVHLLKKNLKKPWSARMQVNSKPIYLGYFETEEEAAHGYDEASKKYHGEYGKRNFND